MTKETFIESIDSQRTCISEAKENITNITASYIESNKTLEIGDKVKIITKERSATRMSRAGDVKVVIPKSEKLAFVNGFKVDFRKEVVPTFFKCKKDGTPSKINEYYATQSDVTIEKVN